MRISDWSSDVCSSDLQLGVDSGDRRLDPRKVDRAELAVGHPLVAGVWIAVVEYAPEVRRVRRVEYREAVPLPTRLGDHLAPESVLLVKRQRPPGFGRPGIGLGFRRSWRPASGEIIFAAAGRGPGTVGTRKGGLPDEIGQGQEIGRAHV